MIKTAQQQDYRNSAAIVTCVIPTCLLVLRYLQKCSCKVHTWMQRWQLPGLTGDYLQIFACY